MTIEEKPVSKHEANQNPLIDTPSKTPHYDRGIVPAETAAREEREKEQFMSSEKENSVSEDSVDTAGGYTVDKEGLVDNFAIEPEMYVNEPGDLRQEQEELKAQRAEELAELGEDEDGKLTTEADRRHRGPGVI